MTNKSTFSRAVCIVAAMLLAAASARAEHFAIELKVTAPNDSAAASADTSPPAKGNHPRPVCHAKAGEELVLQFFFTSNFPHGTIPNVVVRYYVAAEQKQGQDSVPGPEGALTQGHFVMDFKPDTGKVGLRQRLKIDKAGVYLVRVESQNSDADHEHFSAIDLVIE